ncbi:MAG: heparan-alpha-glucosaminide N-acetyltransferase domain-containing protein, partial [Promethearchaeota archaeon]
MGGTVTVKLKSIELIKGLSILIILISNAVNYWLVFNSESIYIFTLLLAFLNLFGPTLYIFTVSFSISFTLNKKMGRIPERSKRNIVLTQGFFMIILGIVFNLITNSSSHFPQNFWGWNILVFLGFSQLISYYIFKLVRWARFVIGLSVIFLTPVIREILFIGKDLNPVIDTIYFVVVSPLPKFSLLPYASISIFSTVFGEFIYESISLNSTTANLRSTNSILKYGTFLLICGLLLPYLDIGFIITGENFDPLKYPFIDSFPILKAYPTTFISGIPTLFYAGTPSNLFIS